MSGLKANNLLVSVNSVRKHAWKSSLESCSGAVGFFLLMESKAKQNNNSMCCESSVIKKSSYRAKQEV